MVLVPAGQLIFVASYYDYLRLRNFLKEQDVQVAALSEYAAPKEAARARSLFLDGRLAVALLTERSHFYNRARVRGVKVCGNLSSGAQGAISCRLASYHFDDLS